ncbi:MAG: protein kinase [Clostridiales bacterium]|nr:protein kinase [Clostridiales bacterium]
METGEKRCIGCMRMIPSGQRQCPHCGFMEEYYQQEFYTLPAGQLLQNGRYELGRSVGEGGFGITYIGWDAKFARVVAIKEFYSKALVSRDNTVSRSVRLYRENDEASKEAYRKEISRVEREARLIRRFEDCPGLVRVEDFFSENNTVYIVMDYIEGMTLRAYCGQHGTVDIRRFAPLIKSLHKMHREGIIHRDLSMDNIMIQQDGSLKILDFGSARPVQIQNETLSVTVKYGYAAPEQYNPTAENQGPWIDVYELCVCIWNNLTGEKLKDAKLREESLERGGKNLPRGIRETLLKGLELDYRKRIQNMNELYHGLYGTWLEPVDEKKKKTISSGGMDSSGTGGNESNKEKKTSSSGGTASSGTGGSEPNEGENRKLYGKKREDPYGAGTGYANPYVAEPVDSYDSGNRNSDRTEQSDPYGIGNTNPYSVERSDSYGTGNADPYRVEDTGTHNTGGGDAYGAGYGAIFGTGGGGYGNTDYRDRSGKGNGTAVGTSRGKSEKKGFRLPKWFPAVVGVLVVGIVFSLIVSGIVSGKGDNPDETKAAAEATETPAPTTAVESAEEAESSAASESAVTVFPTSDEESEEDAKTDGTSEASTAQSETESAAAVKKAEEAAKEAQSAADAAVDAEEVAKAAEEDAKAAEAQASVYDIYNIGEVSEKYEGEQGEDGHANGYSVYYFENGDKYVGEWLNGSLNYGAYYWSNGDKYVGEWSNGKLNGCVVLYCANGEKYAGEWSNGSRNGYGVCEYVSGAYYAGEWTQGELNGKGIFHYANGNSYAGEWADEHENGYGVLTSADGSSYKGEFVNGYKNGYGILYHADGSVAQAGIWEGNEYQG